MTDARRQLDLLIHPVRIRVLSALSRCPLTTSELDAEIPDVPRSSLYRHIRLLRDEGVIEEEARVPAGGAPERRYRLTAAVHLDPARLATMTGAQHVEALTAYLMGLLSRFSAVVGPRARVDLVAERIGYREATFHASDAELDAAFAGVNAALMPLLQHGPGPGRRHRVLSTVSFPTLPPDVAGAAVPTSDEPEPEEA